MRIVIIITFTSFLLSCKEEKSDKLTDTLNSIMDIRILSKYDSILTQLSDIAIDIEYIPLKPTLNSPINAVDKIIVRGDKIYLNLINNILCFDNRGNFLYKLYGKEGITYAIYDFDINSADSTLVILAGNKLLHFKITTLGFEHIQTINLRRLSPSRLDFVPGTNNILLSSARRKGFDTTLHILINLKGDTLSYKPNYFTRFNPVKYRMYDVLIQFQFNNKLYFRERFNDTVFSLIDSSSSFVPEYILNSKLSSTNSQNINDPEYFKVLPNISNIFEVPRYLYYEYEFNQLDHKIFFDKIKDQKYIVDPLKGVLIDDIGGGPDFDPVFCSEGKMFAWISIKGLKKITGHKDFANIHVKNPKKREYLMQLSDSLKETDNPILIIITPKH